jgi:hypothetical protein
MPAFLAGRRFEQALAQKMALNCANARLGEVLKNLTANHHVAIVLDRRIDPEQLVSLNLSDASLRTVLQQLAKNAGTGISFWEPLVYLGPPSEAAALRTLAHLRDAEVAALPTARRQALSAQRAWSWDDLATPRDLIAGLASEAHLKVEGIDLIPHDLWPARRLPPLAWSDRLTLVAAEFGLTYEVARDGRSVRLTPMPEKATARRSFPAAAAEPLGQLAEQYPQASLQVEGDQLVVEGSVEDLESLSALVAESRGAGKTPSAAKKKPPAGKQVYKLKVELALDEALSQLGKQLDVDFQLDRPAIERAGISLSRIVTVEVEGASLDELLAAVLEPAGLKATRTGRTVKVTPRDAATGE